MQARLRRLVSEKKTIAVPGAFNAMSAMLVEKAGFEALYISGGGLSNANGFPDTGQLSRDEAAALASYIIRSVKVPAIMDVDTGFGGPDEVKRTVEVFEGLGAEAVQIEDQTFPKRCGHLPGKEVIPAEEFARKIKAAASARKDKDFLIIARTDARAVGGLEDAIERAKRYLDAGADMIFPEALKSAEEFSAFAYRVEAPLVANMTEFGKTPYLSVYDFRDMGYSIVLFPMTAFRVAMKAAEEAFKELKNKGTQKNLLEKMLTREEINKLLGYSV